MTLKSILTEAAKIAKRTVLENLDEVTKKTGTINPFGDQTLILDKLAEDNIIEHLQNSDTSFAFFTEEQGVIFHETKPEYIAVIDPIDGSTNLERGIPLVSVGISAVPYSEMATTDDVEISIIESFFTEETYLAISGKGVTRNGRRVSPTRITDASKTIISYDTKRDLNGKFGDRSLNLMRGVHDIRRTGSNLLDLCWTASGALDAMIDLRGLLPLVHISGTHMVFEAGGYVCNQEGKRFRLEMNIKNRMSFVAAGTQSLGEELVSRFK